MRKLGRFFSLLALALAGCVEPKSDPTLEIAAAVGRAANSIRVGENRWCPQRIDGRELTHSIWRDSDARDPALVCFYARTTK